MQQKLILLFFSIFIFISGYSQKDSINIFKYGFEYEAINKYSDLTELNETLEAAGIAKVNNELLGISLGIYSRRLNEKSYATGNLTWLQTRPPINTDDSITSKINIYEYSTDMHWVISKNIKWYLYPYCGIGMSISQLKLKEKESFNQSISVLSSQAKYINESPLFFANLGLGVDRMIHIQKLETFIGLNFGYRFSTKSGWGYDDSPLVSYSGFEMKARVRIEFDSFKDIYR